MNLKLIWAYLIFLLFLVTSAAVFLKCIKTFTYRKIHFITAATTSITIACEDINTKSVSHDSVCHKNLIYKSNLLKLKKSVFFIFCYWEKQKPTKKKTQFLILFLLPISEDRNSILFVQKFQCSSNILGEYCYQ